ncbi:MAG: tetratricopeptide repeat protein [Desulforhopalus sp.]
MKKIVWSAIAVCCAFTLWGCAVPEKTKVSPPYSRTAPVSAQPTTGYPPPSQTIETGSEPKTVSTPSYLDIDEDPLEEAGAVEFEVVLPTMAYVNDRIFEYGRKLERWKELDSQSVTMELSEDDTVQMVRCFRRLQNVLNGYSGLRTQMLQAQKVTTAKQISNEEIFELQKSDVAFLENYCGRLLADSEDQSVGWDQREEGADLAQLETLIDRYSANREYEEVIQVWSQVPEYQIGRIHLRTKILYGNALMYLHQEEKAAEIYQQVVDQMSDSDQQATDLVSLRRVLADLYTASGNYKAAEREYKKISNDYENIGRLEEWSKYQLSILGKSMEGSPELGEFSSMLRNYLGFIPEQDGYKVVWQAEKFLADYPYSPVASNVDFIKYAAQQDADKWFNRFMGDVDRLGAEKQFVEALELLETLPKDIINADKQLIIEDKNEALLLAEAVDRETNRMALIQGLQDQWNNGLLLAKAGRYDEAIDLFTNLLDTEYSVKAEIKIEELALEAAKADRRQAANLFIRFTKTTDIESRKKLLIESRRLLKNILVKYPEVEIAPKVLGNIDRVEQEMIAIDPGLVALADQQERQSVQLEGIDSVFGAPAEEPAPQATTPIIETTLDLQEQ